MNFVFDKTFPFRSQAGTKCADWHEVILSAATGNGRENVNVRQGKIERERSKPQDNIQTS